MTWVVPCYNEAQRLDASHVAALVADPGTHVLLVDDGSKDDTLSLLRSLETKHAGRLDVLALSPNGGKAEAVRQGMLQAARTSEVVGYADADFSTPPAELHRLAATLRDRQAEVVIGARVGLAGSRVHRKPMRHYLGRLFGTAASLLLGTVIYDTQCGAKLFRVSPLLEAALAEPFGSRWIFDVELLGRLLIGMGGHAGIGEAQLIEVPLHEWRDVAGSKLGAKALAEVPRDLIKLRMRLGALRGRAG